MSTVEVRTPPLGDFAAVDVVEIHVKPGDRVSAEDPLVTLETDKATMDVPAPRAGTVVSVALTKGAKVSAGDLVLTLDPADAAVGAPAEPASKLASAPPGRATAASAPSRAAAPQPAAAAEPRTAATPTPGKRVAVIGAGPGGYTAAFRAADIGIEFTLVERWPTLGGVCFKIGCIT